MDVKEPGTDKDVDAFFDQLATQKTNPANPQYKPFEAGSKTQKRIEIIQADGSASYVAYQFLYRVLRSAGNTMLTMIFNDVVITIEGENLHDLAKALHDEKVAVVTCFNPDKHEPPEPGTACIGNITEQDPREFRDG